MATACKTYHVAFKISPCNNFPHGLSDSLGINFRSVRAAERYIRKLEANPADVGECPEMQTASLWVVDGDGEICFA